MRFVFEGGSLGGSVEIKKFNISDMYFRQGL